MKPQKITPAEYGQKMKELVNGILELQDLEIIQHWFVGLGRNIAFGRNYSPSNMLMVYKQEPDAIWTEGPNAWNAAGCYWNAQTAIWVFAPAAFGVQCSECKQRVVINKGLVKCPHCEAKLPEDLKPTPLGFKLIPVFDFADIEVGPKGEKNPKVLALRELQKKRLPMLQKYVTSEGAQFAKAAAALIRYVEARGVDVKTKALNGKGGFCTPGVIVYDEALAMGENLGVLTHEWGHLRHHYGEDRNELSKQTKELEGEMFSALVLGGLGANIRSKAAYLLNWSNEADKKTREALFIKAFHRVYHEAVETLKAVTQAIDPEISGIISQIEPSKETSPAQTVGEKPIVIPEAAKPTEKKMEIKIRRPRRLGSITADLERATKTLVADSGRFPGEAVRIQILLPNSGVLNSAMLLDPVLLSGRYLQNGGAYGVPGTMPLLLPHLTKDMPGTQPTKVYIEEISLQVNSFTREVDSFTAANAILSSLATKITRAIGPKAKCRLVFEDGTLYECDMRLRKGQGGGQQILQEQIKRKCNFLTGVKPEIVSDELYRTALKEHSPEEIFLAEKILHQYSLEDPIKPEKFSGAGQEIGLFDTLFGPNYQPSGAEPDPEDQAFLSGTDYAEALGDPTRVVTKKQHPVIVLPALSLGSIEDQMFGNDTIEEASTLLGIPEVIIGMFELEANETTIRMEDLYETDGTPRELAF